MKLADRHRQKLGLAEGQGLGKLNDGRLTPLQLRTVISMPTHDFNHFAGLYNSALARIDVVPEEQKAAPPVETVFEGTFVKATPKPDVVVKKPVAIEDESQLLAMCGNRTARRSVKRLNTTEEELKAHRQKVSQAAELDGTKKVVEDSNAAKKDKKSKKKKKKAKKKSKDKNERKTKRIKT